MRWMGPVALILLPLWAGAQLAQDSTTPHDHSCSLPATHGTPHRSDPYQFRGDFRAKEVNFTIDYAPRGQEYTNLGCQEWSPAAKQALEYATEIWSDALQNKQPVDVEVCLYPFEAAAGQTLGRTSTNYRPITNSVHGDRVFYPKPIYESIANEQTDDYDIRIFVNANIDFYYGTDMRVGANQIDFVTFALHELAHGLGFQSFSSINEDQGRIGAFSGVGEDGNPIYEPTIYDLLVDVGNNDLPITDLPNPSTDIADALRGRFDGLYLDLSNVTTYRVSSGRLKLYTPGTYSAGRTYSHLEDPDELMSYNLSYGTAKHDVTTTAAVLAVAGWPVAADVAAPVELLSFSGRSIGSSIVLDWATASETDNDQFTVERSDDGEHFVPLGQLTGHGSTRQTQNYTLTDEAPRLGTNYYRLRQTDFDGTTTLSRVIAVDYTQDSEPMVSEPYPNPSTTGTVYLNYLSSEQRQITTQLIDVAGRVLHQRLHQVGKDHHRLEIEVLGLPSGIYSIRIEEGSNFTTRRLVIH